MAKHQEAFMQRFRMDDDGSIQKSSADLESLTSSYRHIVNRNERNEREIRRLRNSVSFQLGLHLTKAVRQPWRLLLLPISFPIFALQLGLRRIGRATSETASGRLDKKCKQHLFKALR